MEDNYLEIALIVAVVLNVIVTFLVAKSESFEKAQKIAQIVIIWVIPFIASIGILIFILTDNDTKLPPSSRGGGANEKVSQLE
ncbi:MULTISPECIES: hypothetical protein [Pseudoalteromonas]|uniref:hypothetical protein n=1 Tax=Pseudoalteromonas TaxID=53246 RepID=UPI0002E4D7EC|nr:MULTISPECIES: hypothetical protein [Pseudoalteromonas]MCF6143894.1 hypothetical protein [Pseudoalteromonas mariniglutinosa NCIMB 1770]